MYGMISRLSNKPDFKIFSVIFEKSIFNRGRGGGIPPPKMPYYSAITAFQTQSSYK